MIMQELMHQSARSTMQNEKLHHCEKTQRKALSINPLKNEDDFIL